MMTAYFIYNESHKVEINERVLQISERVRRSKLKLKMEKKAEEIEPQEEAMAFN